MEKRKLGSVTKWLKCPSCGVREEVETQPSAKQDKSLKQKQRQIDERGYYDEEGYNTY